MQNRKAVITGAGQGMGKAIALNFAQQGIHPVLVGRTRSKLDTVAEEIASLTGNQNTSIVIAVDLTDSTSMDELASVLAEDTIDILVNCAGDWLIKPLQETTDADFDHILGINLRAPYQLARLLLPNLKKSDNGSIINIGSLAAVESFGGISAYTAAKTGLRGLTGSLADELRPENIRVVMLSPSPADTPMRWAATPDMDANMLVQADTIADVVSMIINLPPSITVRHITLESMRLSIG
ncbi:MAG: SDR family oxidoreductase [Chloroflexota bacterium]